MAFQLFFCSSPFALTSSRGLSAIRARLTAAQLALIGAAFAALHSWDRPGNANTHVNLYVQGGMLTHYHARSLN